MRIAAEVRVTAPSIAHPKITPPGLQQQDPDHRLLPRLARVAARRRLLERIQLRSRVRAFATVTTRIPAG